MSYYKVLFYRVLAHLAFLGLFVFSLSFIQIHMENLNEIFFIFSLVALSHLLVIKIKLEPESLFFFFVMDAFLALSLVKASGASTSPFLIIYPIVVLSAAVLFSRVKTITIMLLCLTLMTFSVGFGISILGNAAAILLVGFLGLYLRKSLSDTGQELAKVESAKLRLESLQKAILNSMPSGVISVDPKGNVIQANPKAEKILQIKSDKLLQKNITEIFPIVQDLEKTLSDESQSRKVVSYTREDTKVLKLGYSQTKLWDAAQDLGFLIVFQDLTHVLEMEESLRRSENLAVVGRLSASIAHEIRNPLASISGSSQMLSELKTLQGEDQKLLNIIQRESIRLDNLITDFLDYVRPQKLSQKEVDLKGVCESLKESLLVNQKWKDLSTQIELDFSEEELTIFIDNDKLSQVLLNFVLNSGQAGAKKIILRGRESAEHLSLEVIDNGEGISEENQKNLFVPFFTTKEKGTGLGLALSYKILEEMGARVEVRSPVPEFCNEGGTKFAMYFSKNRGELAA